MKRLFVLISLLTGLALWEDAHRHRARPLRAGQEQRSAQSGHQESLRVAAKNPAEALQSFQVLDGFRMELIAQEPLVQEPIVICYDENGLLYVAEYLNFPKPATEGNSPIGRIRLLVDRDNDGHYDQSHIFADGLTWPAGIAPWKGGVFVASAPDIWYFKDTDGDHKADVIRKVYSDFDYRSDEGIANNLIWGLDHKIYGAGAGNRAHVRRTDKPDARAVSVSGRDFRFDPVSGQFEAISGTEQFGNTFDDWNNRFICSNSNPAVHVVLPARYLARNPYLPVPGVRQRIWSDARVYRASRPEPWRVARTKIRLSARRNWAAPYVSHDVFTATTGVTIYRGDAYPEKYWGNLFVGDVQSNLVHRRLLVPSGVSFRSLRADQNSEMVRSTDNWFRPANLSNAPDGTLHIVDMYREVIETPLSLPEEIQARLDLLSGHEYGRIYRLAPPGFQLPPAPRLRSAGTQELIAHLENPNGWWRDTAHRLLYERQDSSAAGALRHLLRRSELPQGRLHALWSLEGLGALRDADLARGLSDPSPELREHAVRLSETRLDQNPRLLEKVLSLTDDENPRVRFQVAFSLGESGNPGAATGLVRIARADASDVWIRTAVLSSSLHLASHMIGQLLDDPQFAGRSGGRELLGELARLVGGRNQPAEVTRLLELVETRPAAQSAGVRRALVLGLGDGLRSSRSSLSRFLDDASASSKMLQALLRQATETIQSDSASTSQRLQAIQLVSHGRFSEVKETIAAVLDARQPPALQLAAVRALAGFEDADVAGVLIRAWRGYTPAVRREVLEALFGRTEWTSLLLDAVAAQKVPASQIEPSRKALLLRHRDSLIRDRASALFAQDALRPRDQVIAQYRPALNPEGNVDRGRVVFERECMTCHRVAGRGHEVGPNLATVQNRSREDLLIQILDPSREMLANYQQYVVLLDNGRVVTGLIATESPSSVTLKRAENIQETILRQNIDQISSDGKSLMPDGLEQKIDHQQLADLIEFLLRLK